MLVAAFVNSPSECECENLFSTFFFSLPGILPNHNIAMLDVTWNCVIYTYFLLVVQPSLFTFSPFLFTSSNFPHPRTWVIFFSRRGIRERGEGTENGFGIFITHNTNFPCLTHFASSNDIIDRYKNKDCRGEMGRGENLFSVFHVVRLCWGLLEERKWRKNKINK